MKSTAPKALNLNNPELVKKVEAERERRRLVERRKRIVYEAICELIDPVSEEKMVSQLHALTIRDWAEVLEERRLGRLCGYPVCSETIQVEYGQKYVLQKIGAHKEFIPVDGERLKFCSTRCMCMARAIGKQLGNEEQHIAHLQLLVDTPAQPRQFRVPQGEEWRAHLDNEEETADGELLEKEGLGNKMAKPIENCPKPAYMEAELLTSLTELKLADNEADAGEKGPQEGEEGSDPEMEEKEFLQNIKLNKLVPAQQKNAFQWKKGFLNDDDKEATKTTTSGSTTKSKELTTTSNTKVLGDVVERLQNKWDKQGGVAMRKMRKKQPGGLTPAQFVEPKPIEAGKVKETM